MIPSPEAKAAATLGPFLTDFVERRIDVNPATKEVWSQVVRNLVDHSNTRSMLLPRGWAIRPASP